MGSVAFPNVILLKSLLAKCEVRKVTEMVGFSQKCGDNNIIVDLHIRTKVPAGRI